MNKRFAVVLVVSSVVGCATLTSDAMTPVTLAFSDGSNVDCHLSNKRGVWDPEIPATVAIRRSDDPLKYQCQTKDGREATGQLASTVGAKIVASAIFIDLGITDAITDKHREYPASFVIPVKSRISRGEGTDSMTIGSEANDNYTKLQELGDLREKGILTDAEFDSEKKKLLDSH